MLVLDTDAISVLFQRESDQYRRLLDRIDREPREDVATTIVSVQEQMQGWLAVLNRARMRADSLIKTYHRLGKAVKEYAAMNVLQFDATANDRLETIRHEARQVAALDLRIASIALVNDATLLSRNLRDFRRVPGLRVEDWSR